MYKTISRKIFWERVEAINENLFNENFKFSKNEPINVMLTSIKIKWGKLKCKGVGPFFEQKLSSTSTPFLTTTVWTMWNGWEKVHKTLL